MATFNDYAGQLVADGIATNVPLADLEENETAPSATAINGLSIKVGRVIIENTPVFGDRIAPYVTKYGDKFGGSIEMAIFDGPAVNKARDGSCTPSGTNTMSSQTCYTNFAYNMEMGVGDREIDKAVLNAEQAAQYGQAKLATVTQGIADLHYKAWKQLLTDVIDGTRSVSSTTRSDGAGTGVTYSTTVVGYAGHVEDSGLVIAAPTTGSVTIITGSVALSFATKLQSAARDMVMMGTAMNSLGVNNFVSGKPLLFAEEKTLDALDYAWAVEGGYVGFPTVTARQFLSNFADVVEIEGAFPALPTNASYSGCRLAAVLIDRNALIEDVKYEDVESMRCTNGRSTQYSFQGESIMAIKRYCNSYALLVDSA